MSSQIYLYVISLCVVMNSWLEPSGNPAVHIIHTNKDIGSFTIIDVENIEQSYDLTLGSEPPPNGDPLFTEYDSQTLIYRAATAPPLSVIEKAVGEGIFVQVKGGVIVQIDLIGCRTLESTEEEWVKFIDRSLRAFTHYIEDSYNYECGARRAYNIGETLLIVDKESDWILIDADSCRVTVKYGEAIGTAPTS